MSSRFMQQMHNFDAYTRLFISIRGKSNKCETSAVVTRAYLVAMADVF